MCSGRHFLPQCGDQNWESVRGVLHFCKKGLEAILWQKPDVFRKHGEKRALKKSGDHLRFMAVGLEGLGKNSKATGNVAGDLGGDLRGIQRVGIEPNGAKSLADLGTVEVLESDAV